MDVRVGRASEKSGSLAQVDGTQGFLLQPKKDLESPSSILMQINPEYSLERLMLKLQYFGHLMQKAASLEKTLVLGKIEGRKRREQQRMR